MTGEAKAHMVQAEYIAAEETGDTTPPLPAAEQDLGLLRAEDVTSFRNIEKALDTGKAVLFVGSGPSAPLYGDWSNLVIDLAKRAGVVPIDYIPRREWPDTIRDLANRAELKLESDFQKIVFLLLDGFRDRLGVSGLGQCLLDRFSGKRDRFVEIHTHLLRSRFEFYVTTNYDCCLEWAAKSSPLPFDIQNIHCYPDPLFAMNATGRSLFHLHGRIQGTEAPDSLGVVLGESDYQAAYHHRADVSDFVKDLLICGRPVIFCGFGFRDHDLFFRCLKEGQAKIRQVREQRAERGEGDTATVTHYAFLGVQALTKSGQLQFHLPDVERSVERFNKRLPYLWPEADIVPVLYGDPYPTDPNRSHMYLTKAFERLADAHGYRHVPLTASKHSEGTPYP